MKTISMILSRLQLIIFITALFFANNTLAIDMKDMDSKVQKVKHSKKHLQDKKYDKNDLDEWVALTISVENTAVLCVSEKSTILKKLNNDLDGLGEQTKGEAAGVALSRKNLSNKKRTIEKEISQCNLYSLTMDEIHNQLNDARVSYLEDIYLEKKPHIIKLALQFMTNPVEIITDATGFLWSNSGVRDIDAIDWLISLFVVLVVSLVAWRIRLKLKIIEAKQQWSDDFVRQLYRGVLTTGAYTVPRVLIPFSIFLFLYYATRDIEQVLFFTQFSFAITIYFLALGVSRLFLYPLSPAQQFMGFPDDIANSIFKRLKILFLTALFGYSAFYTIFSESLGQTNLLLVRYVFSLIIVINLVWIIHVLAKSPKYPKLSLLARLVNIVLILTLLIEWLGYINMSFAIRRGVLLSFVLLISFLSAAKILQIIFDAMDKGKKGWSRRLHKKISVEPGEKIPGLIWFRFTLSILLWSSFVVFIVSIWDINGSILEHLKSNLINGFAIGDIRIVPGRIIWALVIFASFLSLAGWIKTQLENKWLLMTNMNAGARNAMATIIGYILFLISVLIGLSIAGFDFGNIAIIAGALSVGIGFGLQNIVNNFVSGLILLFERPIRKGDWIVVGSTEGYVKNIQIRSTLIRTFDNSDVIVPNSELISNQVTNWMLSSKNGRAIIPVGVAYGTDIEKVRDILLELAINNDKIIQTGEFTKPRVLFREFGDSSLNFELRVFLKEISGRLSMISEFNFAIDKAFREANIEIPFPQRDINLKTLHVQLDNE